MDNSDGSTSDDVLREQTDALAKQVMAFTRHLYLPEIKSLATGVAVNIEDHFFIATAGHVLGGSASVHLSVPTDRNGQQIEERLPPLSNHVVSKDYDIGFVQVPTEQAAHIGRWVTPKEMHPNCPIDPRAMIWLAGFPQEDRYTLGQRGVARPTIYSFDVRMPENWPSFDSFDLKTRKPHPEDDILLEIPEKCDILQMGPGLPAGGGHARSGESSDPTGTSGGGIWVPTWAEANKIQIPIAQLVAIQSSFYKSERLSRGVQIKHWLDLVLKHHPSLKSSVGDLKNKQLKLTT